MNSSCLPEPWQPLLSWDQHPVPVGQFVSSRTNFAGSRNSLCSDAEVMETPPSSSLTQKLNLEGMDNGTTRCRPSCLLTKLTQQIGYSYKVNSHKEFITHTWIPQLRLFNYVSKQEIPTPAIWPILNQKISQISLGLYIFFSVKYLKYSSASCCSSPFIQYAGYNTHTQPCSNSVLSDFVCLWYVSHMCMWLLFMAEPCSWTYIYALIHIDCKCIFTHVKRDLQNNQF